MLCPQQLSRMAAALPAQWLHHNCKVRSGRTATTSDTVQTLGTAALQLLASDLNPAHCPTTITAAGWWDAELLVPHTGHGLRQLASTLRCWWRRGQVQFYAGGPVEPFAGKKGSRQSVGSPEPNSQEEV